MFGRPPLPFSVSLEFPPSKGRSTRARSSWRAVVGRLPGDQVARAAFDIAPVSIRRTCSKLRDLFDIVGRFDACDVLVDDRPVPYARELWLPLIWFLIR